MNKTIALFAIAGLSMTSEIDGFADDNLRIFNPEQQIRRPVFTALHTVDDELRVLPIDYSTSSGSRPHIYYTDDELRVSPVQQPRGIYSADDELRVLPIDYHPPRPSGPSKPIWTDDELRILPIVDKRPPSGPSKPIRADDEFRVLPIDYSTSSGSRPHIYYTDDELRVFPIDYNAPRIHSTDDELAIFPLSVQSVRTSSNDDELRVLPIDYHPPRPSGPSKPVWTDDELVYYDSGVYYGNGFRILPIENSKPSRGQNSHRTISRPVQNSGRILADDELRTIPAMATYILNKYGKKDTAPKPISEEIANDDEYVAMDSRMIGVGAGSLTRPRRNNATETAKPVSQTNVKIDAKHNADTIKPIQTEQEEARLIGVGAGSLTRPKKNTTATAQPVNNATKIAKPLPIRDLTGIPVKAADDELRFAHLFSRRPHHKKNTTQTTQEEVVSSQAADNSLSELSHLLNEGRRGKGFLGF